MTSIVDALALSPTQAGMVAVSAAQPTYDPYLVTLALDLTGVAASQVPELRRALEELCRRHGHLAGQIRSEGLPHPVLLIRDGARPVWQTRDLRAEPDPIAAAQQIRTTEGNRPLPLSTGPLTRATLLQVSGDATDGHYVLLLTMHHVVVDGWCLPRLIGEYAALLGGAGDQVDPPVPLRTYASWIAAQDRARSEDAWRDYLAGILDMPRVGRGTETGGAPAVGEYRLGGAATTAVQDFAQAHGLTLATLIQLAWGRVLSSAVGQDDVAFGSTSSGRHPDIPGGDRIIGGLVTSTPVRVRIDERSPAAAGAELQTQLAHVRRHDWLGSAGVAQAVGAGGRELFDTLVVVENTPIGDSHQPIGLGGNATARLLRVDSPSHYPVTLVALVDNGELVVRAECYDTQVPDGWSFADPQRTARRVAHVLTNLVTARSLAEVGILLDDETATVPGAPAPTRLPDCLAAAFQMAAARTPQARALADNDGELTFEECHAAVTALADTLRRSGVNPGEPVAVALPRDRRVVIAPFAVAAAGGVTIHLDPTQPVARMAQILTDSGATRVLTDAVTAAALGEQVPGGVHCGTPEVSAPGQVTWQKFGDPGPGQLPSLPEARRLAYVVFTSGSTGRAKGVAVSHEALLSYWRHHDRHVLRPMEKLLGRPMRVAHAWSTGFDAAWQPQVALLSGQCVQIIDEQTRNDPGLLVRALAEHTIDMIDTTPSMMLRLLSAGLLADEHHRLSVLALGGEAIAQDLWDRLRSLGIVVWNCYGPTEATVECFMARVDHHRRPTIGHPLDAMAAAVLDHRLRPLPAGMSGQLAVWGTQLAEGYLGRPEENAAAFRILFNAQRGYLTGDRARRSLDDTFAFEGRCDEQVKINGYRVEPEESATVLRCLPGVRDACVVVEEDSGRPFLGALVVTDRPASEVRSEAATRLPAYLLPRVVVAVPQLPMTRNGKLDRAAATQLLAAADLGQTTPTTAEASPALADLLTVVSRLTGRTPTPSSRFDELGVDSIGLMDVVTALRRPGAGRPAWQVRVLDLVESLSLADAALQMKPAETSRPDASPKTHSWPLPRLARAYVATCGASLATIAQSQVVTLPEADEAELRQIVADLLADLVTAHPILAARLDETGTTLLSGGAPPRLETLPADQPLADARTAHLALLNPWRGPLCAAGIRRGRPGQAPLLLITVHHLAVDVVSWRVLGDDIERLGQGQAIDPEQPLPHDSAAATARDLPDREPRGPALGARHADPRIDRELGPALWHRASAAETDAVLAMASHGIGVDDILGIVTAMTDQDIAAAHGHLSETDHAWYTVETHGREGMEDTRAVGWFTAERTRQVRLPPTWSHAALMRALAEAREDDHALAASCLNYLGRLDLMSPMAGAKWQFLPPEQLVHQLGSPGVGSIPARFSMTLTAHVETTAEGPVIAVAFAGAAGLLGPEQVEQYALRWLTTLENIIHATEETDR